MKTEHYTANVAGVSFAVQRIPGMKRLQLTRTIGVMCKPVAGFRDDKDAEEFADWLEAVVLGSPQVRKG